MNYLRRLIFVVWLYGWGIITGLICLPVLLAPKSWVRVVIDAWLKMIFGGLRVINGVNFEISGAEHLPQEGGLIACKHQSMFDVYMPWLVMKKPSLVMKQALLYVPVFGWYSWKMGNIPINRDGGARALRELMATAKQRIDDGHSVMIFPEGTRTEVGHTVPYKPGIAALYKSLGQPCTPIALHSRPYWPTLKRPFKKGTIEVRVLPPIEAGLDRKVFMQKLEDIIEEHSHDLAEKSKAHGKNR